MASVFPLGRIASVRSEEVRAAQLARAISFHIAGALVLFAIVQVLGVFALIDMPGGRVLPVAALAVLIVIAIPFARRLERRWSDLAVTALPSRGLHQRFVRDRSRLWALATAGPVIWLSLYAATAQAMGL